MDGNHRVIVGLRIKPPGIADTLCPHADMVFWNHTNMQIYEELVHPHTTGTEFSTIFTYGRTGSGKTYTMFGDKEMPGISELMLNDILKSHNILTVRCTEIYNEVATDLFTGQPIRIVQENNSTRIISETQITVKSQKDIKDLLMTISKKRKTSETEHNINSSRSHTVIEINAVNLTVNLVDLAGNERMAEDLERRKEGLMINKSLLTLGKVIDQLHTDTHHVSYRESKLTRILQNTLSYGRIICMCTVLDLTDQLTIKFAERLKRIKTMEKPVRKSKDEIIHDLNMRIDYLTEQLQNMQKTLPALKSAIDSPTHQEGSKSPDEGKSAEEWGSPKQEESAREERERSATAEYLIEKMSEPENGKIYSNLYEIIYKYLKSGVAQEMTNTLTPQEMNQVHVTVMKQKKGLLRGTPFRSIFKISRTEMRSNGKGPSSEDK